MSLDETRSICNQLGEAFTLVFDFLGSILDRCYAITLYVVSLLQAPHAHVQPTTSSSSHVLVYASRGWLMSIDTLDVFLAIFLTLTTWGAYHRIAHDVRTGHRFVSVWLFDGMFM